MSTPSSFPIVGVGASAGGVEALEAFFEPMAREPGMAFVIVTHLAPGHESALAEIIGRHTSLKVTSINDGDLIEADHVYVLPRQATLTIQQGTLRLGPSAPDVRIRNPIDNFFSSLAEDQGNCAVGIILSGAGSDGTLGVKAIKGQGGLTLAQGTDGTAPKHESMPSSAIETGLVDLVVPVGDMAQALADFAFSLQSKNVEDNAEAIEKAKEAIYRILRDQLGHDFAGYKDKTFLRRVHRRMQILQIHRVAFYVERLRHDPDEANLLFRDLLISVTDFFRDSDAFAALETMVIPGLFEGKGAGDIVRVWVPACATGEEVYSIAILLYEQTATMRGAPKVQVFGTDIDDAALNVARVGQYPSALLKNIAPERLERFFTGDDTGKTIIKEVRDLCIFSSHSLIRDPPFSRIDLVSCRNLLIYFGPDLQNQVIPIFHYALRPGGYLFFGLSENVVSQHADLFAPIDKKHRIFRRRDHATRIPLPLRIPGLAIQPKFDVQRPQKSGNLNLRQDAEAHILEHHSPAYVVVNQDHDIVYYAAHTGKYLEAAAGTPNRQILPAARKGLRVELREALRLVSETRRPVIREAIPVEIDDRLQLVTLKVSPLGERDGETLFIVLFVEVGSPVGPGSIVLQATDQNDATVTRLERELSDHRERLQSTIEEYETAIEELRSANEELISGNEEIQSTNEEMESSKEELQSVNEEILTVNAELNRKIEALNEANSDLRNLFESTQIATIFLDRHLVIRNYTPAVTSIFNLIPSDNGRPLTDIVSSLDKVNLRTEFRAVLDAREPIERRISAEEGQRQYLMRLLPYRTAENEIDGLLVTFIDITSVLAAEAHQKLLIDELNHRVRNMLASVIGIARKTVTQTPELAESVKIFLARLHAMANAYEPLARSVWTSVPLRDVVLPQLTPYLKDPDQAKVQGPSILVQPRAALALGLMIHELATNALKFGALSAPAGFVTLDWRLDSGPQGPLFIMEWREAGGPPVGTPTRRGFGSELIERTVSYELNGDTDVEFAPSGVKIVVTVPLEKIGTSDADIRHSAP